MKVTTKSVKSWAIWCDRQVDKQHDAWKQDLWTDKDGVVKLFASRDRAKYYGKPVRVTITVKN